LNGKRKVLIVIPRLVAGGSEKVLNAIAAGLDRDRFEVHVAVLSNVKAVDRANIPAHITVHELGPRHARYAGIGLLRLIWKVRPSVVLAAGGPSGVLATLAKKLAPRGTRVIVRQGTMPVASARRQKPWERRAFAWSQRHADQVICQSKAMAADVMLSAGAKPERVRVLRNPVAPPAEEVRTAVTRVGPPRWLAVGRLAPEKRFDLVIRAFAIFRRECAGATLTIVGDGPCRRALEGVAHCEGVEDCVRFVGYQRNATAWMCDSHALVMASEFEGLPNIVLEALSVGLPVIAVACPGGIREIAEIARNITLVDEATPTVLARAMAITVAAPPSRELPGPAFWKLFGLEAVVKEYEQVLGE
jgi:glycosyltransferase involved in cell wall biosynthesis